MRPGMLVATVLAATCVACGDGGSSTGPSSTVPHATVPGAETVAESAPTPSGTVAPPASPRPTEPTGAPGIDDDDAFCAAWARYSATPPLLVIAANFGALDPVAMARLEVVAAPAVGAAVAEMAAAFPSELEAERDTYFTSVVGPFAGRAERATASLLAAGATDADRRVLVDAWLESLRTRDPVDPVPRVPVFDERLSAIVDGAASSFEADVTPILDDPSMVVIGAPTPAVDAYLTATCPDLSALGIGDAI